LLPYLEQQAIHRAYDFSESWDGPNNRKLADPMPRVYHFYGEERPGTTTANYLAVVGAETVWPAEGTVSRADAKDGLSTTILIVENRGAHVPWMEPRDLGFATMDFRLNQPNGVSSRFEDPAVAMLDGSVLRLGKDLSPATLRALLTIRGGEEVGVGAEGWEVLADGRDRRPAAP
jgi:hypothetical protein